MCNDSYFGELLQMHQKLHSILNLKKVKWNDIDKNNALLKSNKDY